MQRLTYFTLEDHAGKWRDPRWDDENKFNATWVEFEAAFNRQFLFETMETMRRAQFYSLEQGDLFVVDFNQKFTTLLTFNPRTQLSEEEISRMFKERFLPRHKDLI